MFSFRQKIFIAYLIGFIIFVSLLFPLSNRLVRSIVTNAMKSRSLELIHRIEFANNDESLIKTLKDQKALLFFRVSVITNERRVLYDSHTKRLLGPRFSQEYIVDHPEVIEAFEKGIGYHEDYSNLLSQKFAYMAIAFDFHGETYVLRTAFPYRYVTDLQDDLELGFLSVALFVLLTFFLLSWLIINHFTRPLRLIVEKLKGYQESSASVLPQLDFPDLQKDEEFTILADTFNALNKKIQLQIDQAKEASKEKEVLLESLTEGVVAVDPTGVVNFANKSALSFLNLSKEKLEHHSFDDVGFDKCAKILDRCQLERNRITDSLEIRQKGRTFYYTLVAAPKNDGTGALLVMQDMTKEIQMLEMRKDFIANASHELKTPITIIQGFAETLHDNPDLAEKIRIDALSKIVKNCQRMTDLILDLLTLSDIENLPLSRRQRFDLIPLLEKCRSEIQASSKDAEIMLKGPEILWMTADPDLLEMAILNLLSNGIKYSTAPAHLEIMVEEQPSKIILSFKDHGIGISQKELPKIFERFYRVDKAHSRKVGGTGLGLSLVHTIVQKHQGEIKVNSEKDVGTTFILVFPKNLDG